MEPAWRKYKKVCASPSAPCTRPSGTQGVLTPCPWPPAVCAADLLSALDFDESGDYLATGDRGGRIVVFERGAADQARKSARAGIWGSARPGGCAGQWGRTGSRLPASGESHCPPPSAAASPLRRLAALNSRR